MLSVIMPVYNGADTIEAQLTALASQDYSGDWELIVADNGSTDATPVLVGGFTDRIPALRVVDASIRRGSPAARNIGVQAAVGSLFAFCDHDDVVEPGWLAAMASALKTHDLVAGVNQFAGTRQPAEDAIESGNRRGNQYGFLPYGQSCNLGIARHAFDAVGGFDEQFLRAADVDLCWRMQLAGYEMHVEPRAVVAKRRRPTVRGVWVQHFHYGLHDVMLFRRFRREGMPRDLRRGLRRGAWLIVHLADLARPGRRDSWARVAAALAGRVVGSIRHRTLYV